MPDRAVVATASETMLTVFMPTRLVNPTNVREFWVRRARRAKLERELVAAHVWAALRVPDPGARMTVWRITAKPTDPKHITLTAYVRRKLDTDGLQAALKSVRDGLQDCGLIHSDGPTSGHVFAYAQVSTSPLGQLGVEITVRAMSGPLPGEAPAP